MFLMSQNTMIILISVIVTVLLLVASVVFFLIAKNKGKKNTISAPFIDALLLHLGNKENIIAVEALESRLKITVNDLELVNLEGLKTLTDQGIFITGNVIKLMFKEDAVAVKNAIGK